MKQLATDAWSNGSILPVNYFVVKVKAVPVNAFTSSSRAIPTCATRKGVNWGGGMCLMFKKCAVVHSCYWIDFF